MQVILVGADFEENLGLGMVAAVARAAGHAVRVVAFNQPAEAPALARELAAARPGIVGLGIQFQHRAFEFLALAERLRAEGYAGHVTAGGHFPTLAWREVLLHDPAIDSVVRHEGETTFLELVAALAAGRPLATVAGLALRDAAGRPTCTPARRLVDDLDALPFPLRYRPHSQHLGQPFVPVLGSRGCWGHCSFCSITSFYRDARACGGGRTFRLRSPENIAAEIARLYRATGGGGVYCFHDDNFLLPRPEDSLDRVRALRRALDVQGVGRIGLVGKCRPECLTPALARELAALGVVRLYVGVENASSAGAGRLHRAVQWPHEHRALEACRQAGIFACYNLLLFEPGATLDDLRDNVRFMREHAAHPVNFCRAEPYHRTPLQQDMAARGRLGGSFLGWDYRIEDDRAEVVFRMCAAAFRPRNFDPEGVANRYMGIGYSTKLVEFFYPESDGRRTSLLRRGEDLTRAITLEAAGFLEEAVDLVATLGTADHDRLERETVLLGLRIAEADRGWHAALDDFFADLEAFVARSRERAARGPASRKARQIAQGVALGASLAVVAGSAPGCGSTVYDPLPGDSGLVDATDTHFITHDDAAPRDTGMELPWADPVPPDSGHDTGVDTILVDPVVMYSGLDVLPPDPPPPDAGWDTGREAGGDTGRDTGRDIPWADPPPRDAGLKSVEPPHAQAPVPSDGRPAVALAGQWRDTATRRAQRSPDLPLWCPPDLALTSSREGDVVRVRLVGSPEPLSTRWQAEGAVEGEGREVCWRPASPQDLLCVAVRSRGGVALLELRVES